MTLDGDSLAEQLELGRSLRPGYVPRDLVSAQLDKFMKAGTAQLNATRRSVRGETIETADFSIEDRRLGGTVDFSIGDLHRLVLELPSVPVVKLRRELDLVGDTPRALKEEDCVGR